MVISQELVNKAWDSKFASPLRSIDARSRRAMDATLMREMD